MAVENVLNTISRGTILEGKIVTKGDIRIEGKVIGTIHCDGKLVIGDHGIVEGYLEARNAHIGGEVRGTVVVKELLQLQEKGKVDGDIYTQRLSVQVGAVFTGNCKMGKDGTVGIQENASGENVLKSPAKPSLNGGHELPVQKQAFQHGS